MTRLSVCSLGVSCNEMIDTPMLLVVGLTDFHIRFPIFWNLKKNENNSEKCERESDCLVQLMALFRGFPRQKYSSSFNVKKKIEFR